MELEEVMETFENINEFLHTFNTPVVTIRLLLSVLLGGAIGYSRSSKGRAAGFKTHVLVCLGSALVFITGLYIYQVMEYNTGDVARLPAQVINGIGFLGAGTIMVTAKNQVKGLTTAAGLWACACIGLAVGAGFYTGAIVTTVLIYIVYKRFQFVNEIAYEHVRICEMDIAFESRDYLISFLDILEYKSCHPIRISIYTEKEEEKEIIHLDIVFELAFQMDKHNAYDVFRNQNGVIGINMKS